MFSPSLSRKQKTQYPRVVETLGALRIRSWVMGGSDYWWWWSVIEERADHSPPFTRLAANGSGKSHALPPLLAYAFLFFLLLQLFLRHFFSFISPLFISLFFSSLLRRGGIHTLGYYSRRDEQIDSNPRSRAYGETRSEQGRGESRSEASMVGGGGG
jgi:hypothetical protein